VARLFPPSRVTVRAGSPLDLDDLAGDTGARALRTATDRIMAAITAELESIRGEAAPAQRFDPSAAGVPTTGNPRTS
jgi:hypothetical protein